MPVPGREYLESVWADVAAGGLPVWANLEWYATDAHGRIGVLSTNGPGWVPRAAFRDFESHMALARFLSALPIVGKPEMLIRFTSADTWRDAAERGLYGYVYLEDRLPDAGYRLAARPAVALTLDSIPLWAKDWLAGVRLRGESFPDSAGRLLDVSRVTGGLL